MNEFLILNSDDLEDGKKTNARRLGINVHNNI
jgi:hypothetical protein